MIDVARKFVRRRQAKSAAMTLLEVMVVTTVSSLLLGTIVSFAIALKRMDRNVRLADIESERLLELAETIRTDIRQGTDVSLPASNQLVITTAGGGERRYEVGREGCGRSVVLPGEEKPRSDLFRIGPAASWTIDEAAEGRHPLFIVTLNRPAPGEGTQRRRMPLVVCGALGADLAQANEVAAPVE